MEWKPWAWKRKATRKGKFVVSFFPWIGETRETKKDVRSREVSPYNRLGSLTYAEPPLHAISTTISLRFAPFVCPVPQHAPSLRFRSRCTVAFGLCIIITITASSSWLVVEKPPRILSFLLLLFPQLPLSSFRSHSPFRSHSSNVRKREMKKRRRRAAYVRVCVLIKFLEGIHAKLSLRSLSTIFCSRLIACFDRLSANQYLCSMSSGAAMDEL